MILTTSSSLTNPNNSITISTNSSTASNHRTSNNINMVAARPNKVTELRQLLATIFHQAGYSNGTRTARDTTT